MANNSSSSKRGFAAMDEQRQREIASKGGKARSARREHSTTNTHGMTSRAANARHSSIEDDISS